MNDTSPSFRQRFVERLRRIRPWLRQCYENALPGPRARRGASLGAGLLLVVFLGFIGYRILSSLGAPVDIAIGVVVAVASMFLAAKLLEIAARVLRALPLWLGFAGSGAAVAIFFFLSFFGYPWQMAVGGGLGLAVVEALLFGALFTATGEEFRRAGRWKRVAVLAAILLTLGANVALAWWLAQPGTAEDLLEPPADPAAERVPLVAAPDPSQPGPFRVQTLTYGSGTDRVRPEFAEGVTIKTEPVDARPYVKGYEGWRRRLRARYWGFDADAFPRNGRVWYPEGDGPFPLVLIVHGNHHMADYSDPGYAYLGELLASRGYIFVSVDENFLNGWIVGGVPRENDARGWMLLQHLQLWREWNAAEGHRFHNKVDMERIALIGHSRGGEAAGHAAAFNRLAYYPDDARQKFDFGFAIRSVIAIAPSDGQYRPADKGAPLEDVSYLVVQGSHDADVSIFAGDRQYNRARFSPESEAFKAGVYIYRANHGQFNTGWGQWDSSPPSGWMLNRAPLLPGEEQRQIARVLFSAFLEATLRDDVRYRAVFRDLRAARHWLPETRYVTRYEDASFRLLAAFEEDVDLTTTTAPGGRITGEGLALWREQEMKFRSTRVSRENNAVYLGWRAAEEKDSSAQPARYTIELPREFAVNPAEMLVLHLSATDEKPPKDDEEDEQEENKDKEANEAEEKDEEREDDDKKKEPLDLTVELVARDGTVARLPLSHFRQMPVPLEARFTKLDAYESRYPKPWEPVLQRFALPLAHFAAAAPGFQPAEVAAVRLVFDRSPEGVVILDRVGFSRR